MKYFILVFLFCFSLDSFSRSSFGGSRSSSSRSYSRPSSSRSGGGSYFGGSRSSGSNTTYSRPSNIGGSNTTYVPQPVVVHSYGSGSGFWNNMFLYSMFSHNQQPQTVVVNGQGQGPIVDQSGVAQQPQVIQAQPQDTGHGFMYYFIWLLIISGVVYLFYWASKQGD